MEKFEKLTSVAAPMGIPNVDTDAIIPKQFLKTIKRAGLGKALFSERRYNDNGEERPDFVLNQGPFRHAKILVAGENFGCGSSREHAPWALLDFGIRCVIAPSFADIFYNNMFKNGMLPIRLSAKRVHELIQFLDRASRRGNHCRSARADRDRTGTRRSTISTSRSFRARKFLLNGYDEIELTLLKKGAIEAYDEDKKSVERSLALASGLPKQDEPTGGQEGCLSAGK